MFEVHEEESPGEPMKPLSELRDKWERQSNTPTPTDEFQAANFHFDRGRHYCAAELQAWLREVDKELVEAAASQGPDPIGPLYGAAISASRNWIRTELLGTTQKPKQEGE